MRFAPVLFLVSLAGCSFDFGSFGGGGAGGAAVVTTSTGTGQGPGATTGTGVTTSTSSTGAGGTGGGTSSSSSSSTSGSSSSSSSSSSSGAGGAPTAYPPCDARTDTFTSFPGQWTVQFGTAGNQGQRAQLTENAMGFALADYQTTNPDNCVMEISVLTPAAHGGTYLRIRRSMTASVGVFYDDASKMMSMSGVQSPAATGVTIQAFGFVITNGNVYYVYRTSDAWHLAGTIVKPGFLSDGQPSGAGFGAVSQNNSDTVTFDDYDTTPIFPSDIGL